jgi:hypothetical protein
MIKVKTIKNIVTVIVGYGTRQIVMAVIKNNTSPEKMKDKFAIGVGTTALTAIAVSASKDYTDKKIDAYYNAWLGFNKIKEDVKEELSKDSSDADVEDALKIAKSNQTSQNNPI